MFAIRHCYRWFRILLKSDIVCRSYDNVYRGLLFSWTQCIYSRKLYAGQKKDARSRRSSKVSSAASFESAPCSELNFTNEDLTLPYLTLPYGTLLRAKLHQRRPYLNLPYLTLPYGTLLRAKLHQRRPYLNLPYLTAPCSELNFTNEDLTLTYLTLPYDTLLRAQLHQRRRRGRPHEQGTRTGEQQKHA